MGLKQWLKTRWNGDNRHKNELNTDKNMANSSKHKTTAFEIQTRDECSSPSPQLKGPHLWLYLFKVAQCTKNKCPFLPQVSLYSYQKKGLLQLTLGNPLLLHWNIQSWNCNHFQKCWEGSYFSLFFYPFFPSTLKYMRVSCRSCDDTLEKVCLFQYHLIYMHIYPLFNEKKKGLIPLES